MGKVSGTAKMSPIKSKGSQWSILVVDADYFLTREVTRALQCEGHRTRIIPLELPEDDSDSASAWYDRFLADLSEVIKQERPDALFTINHLGFDCDGRLTKLLEAFNLPALVWYVDSPRYILLNHLANVSDWVGIFLWERAYEPWLRQIGYEKVDILPLAADPATFSNQRLPHQQNAPSSTESSNGNDSTLVFIGDSMQFAVAKAFGKLPPHLRPDLSMASGRRVADVTVRFCDVALANLFYHKKSAWDILAELEKDNQVAPSLDLLSGESESQVEEQSPENGNLRLNFESALVLMATRLQRTRVLKELAASALLDQLVVYGDDGWKNVLNGTTQILSPVDYYRDLAGVYQQAGTVLNLTSLQMPTALNQRCYDVPAAGGFLLTDIQSSLFEQFEVGKELACFESIDDLRQKWDYYYRNPVERNTMIEAGRRRVLADHTYRHRIRKMLKVAEAWFK